MEATEKRTYDELQLRIDELQRQRECAATLDEQARIGVELSQLLMEQHFEKTPEQLEEEDRQLLRDFEDGKLIDFKDILSDLAEIK